MIDGLVIFIIYGMLFIIFGMHSIHQYGMLFVGCGGYLLGTILMCVSVREIAIIFITETGLKLHPDIFSGFTAIVYLSVLIYLIIKYKKTEVNSYD